MESGWRVVGLVGEWVLEIRDAHTKQVQVRSHQWRVKRRVLMLQWKIYHFSSDFRANKRKFKLSSRSRASDTFRKNFFFSWDRHALPKEGQNLRKRSFLWWFYSEKFTIFQAIPEIFFGNWLLDASATFRLCYLYSILSMVPKIGTKG